MLKQCIHQLFEAQVARTPQAIAVVFGQKELTYQELDFQANLLANYLQELGVGTEVLVGICLDRSLEMIVGLLGILKAGGAYVPLDPAYPAERLSYMVQDAQISVLVTQEKWSTLISDYSGQVICLDSQQDEIFHHSDRVAFRRNRPLVNTVKPHNLAYVIYTSGSTGKPKGVMIEHHSLVNFTQMAIAQYKISECENPTGTLRERILQFSSMSFDVAAEEIYPCLSCGATLVLRTEDMINSVASFVQQSQDWQITVWDLPTAYWYLIVNELATGQITLPESLRLVIIGGEPVLPEQVKMWLKCVGKFPELINAYGPTETTIEATLCSLSSLSTTQLEGTAIPIGKPMGENIHVYVLDQNLQPVPTEVIGEIYISGAGLARGYFNRPELTTEKFIENPFDNSKLYKTGDLGRYLPDGNLEFVGRIDYQVKFNGFRIELGEIESVLNQHPQVSQSVVIVREDSPGNKRLVAYLVLHLLMENTLTTVESFLKYKLPSYMIPSVLISLETLPLTPNGKVDRQALPIPDPIRPHLQEAFLAPRNAQEETLAEIWCQVFGWKQIGVNDNFFQLGGHSLIATQILSRIRDVFQVELSFKQLLENPTINDLIQVIKQQQLKQPSPQAKITPISRKGYLRVSFAQERVYFIEQLAPSMTAYQFQESLRFQGDLNIPILEQSLSEILRRHEIFRTTFPAVEGKLVQVIHPPQPVKLEVIDLQSVSKSEQEAEVQRLTDIAVQKPFKISELPLIRWTLLKLNHQEHVLVHVEHHMVHDGWSFNLFLRELLTLYQAFSEGKPSPLAEPSLQFADFAHWQRQWVLTEEAQAQLNYWQQKLSGSPPLLELPLDRPRPVEQTYQGGMLRMELPLDVCEALRNMGRQEGVTLFMSMFAVFVTMLYRYTGQEDLCVGSGVANRRWRETEGLIGMIVNNIVLRTDVSGNPTFRELLAQVRQVTLEGYANEDLPFDKVVEILKPERNLSYNPLFQVMFSFHDAHLPELRLPGLTIKQHETLNNKSAKFDLDIVVIPRFEQRVGRNSQDKAKGIETEGITLVWEYNSDLFDAATVERMMAQYQILLEGIVANPDQPISQYPLLTSEQQQQLLVEWNQTKTAYPEGKCIHQLVEEQGVLTPDAVAVVFENQKLTYQELNTQANQLAHYLRNLGVKPDTLVGICIERSLEMIVGLLGILKAAGAYVPLDPAYPAQRLTEIINDAQIPILVTMQQWATLEAEHPLQMVCLDTQKDLIAANQSQENPVHEVAPSNLAYVIYTSGSTGKPKGVLIEHRSLVNFTQAAIAQYKITASERVLQFASISFDTAAEEIYPCLSCGGTLVLRTEKMLQSVSAFIQQSQQWGLTVWDLPTAYWHLLVSELTSGNLLLPESLRLVILGGERVLPEKVAMWHQVVGNYPQLVNSYGPTETSVVATLSKLSDNVLNHQEVPIGKPINNVQIYVLDQYLQPVPIGVPGELHIGGAGVARGYLNRPELTLQKFIPNPFDNSKLRSVASKATQSQNSKLYKTGDLVRYRPDGNLEYLGRMDSQVKIRGFRIELGEIETVLNQHPQVAQAVVIAHEENPGNKRLVAYMVGNQGQVQIDEIRQFLKQKLPPYMVPSAFVPLDQLPMTPNGKVDYRALPAPDTADRNVEVGFVAPRTPTEEKLAAIWAEVLRRPNISIHNNFFELGGDSIISIQMISRANQAGLQLIPKQLFQHQTIAELATVVGTTSQIKANQGVVTGSVPLTPIQHWFFEQNFPDADYFNQSALLEIPSGTKPELLKQAVQQLLSHHDTLRSCFARLPLGESRFVLKSVAPQQINDPLPETVPFTIVDLSELSPEAQQTAIKTKDAELQASLNLSSGEIIKVALFNLGINQPSQLLIIIHHLAVDGISWRILLEDLATAYQQLNRGEAIKLPPKTTSFQEWANQLQAYSQSQTLATEINYWLSQFEGNIVYLPRDYSLAKEENTIAATNSLTLFLNEDETRALLQDVPSAYNTQINDILLTALVQSFSQWTGENSLVVDLEGHGREDLFEDVDLSRTVGWFTTLFPVQLKLSSVEQLEETLKLVKEQLRRLPKHGIGYGILRYLYPNPEVKQKFRNLPQAEVSFNYLGQFDQVLSASAMFGSVKEWKSEQSRRGNRSHLLAVSGLIHSGKLEMEFAYSEKIHKRSSIERLSFGFMEALKTVITHCQSKESQGYTPSDFAAAKLNQQQLDKFLAKINRKKPGVK
ncbi:non-ribosomal peptide synthetase [Brasilonema octagenarum UFV-E1]|uniref:Non-ribosomal peptide synthetase n=1 Tax=Brasilonema sennae CENA114 TaxID=415709 RepID=A0A856MKG1_9CYAN|nr:non-ribosomal peptide synthetase [Brasilonema sennae]QDL09667.1 non-ribosomal peptide synthetase [Brasilonema sennae CENA114]QDL16021.1 non-ribosomal peptide synthetase [Brasilonema octagenarum UFV-E1]